MSTFRYYSQLQVQMKVREFSLHKEKKRQIEEENKKEKAEKEQAQQSEQSSSKGSAGETKIKKVQKQVHKTNRKQHSKTQKQEEKRWNWKLCSAAYWDEHIYTQTETLLLPEYGKSKLLDSQKFRWFMLNCRQGNK